MDKNAIISAVTNKAAIKTIAKNMTIQAAVIGVAVVAAHVVGAVIIRSIAEDAVSE